MPISKRFIHDKVVLLSLSISAFLVLLCTVLILLRLGGGTESYIVQYRSNIGISAYTPGDVTGLLAFIVFALLVSVFHALLGMRVYSIRRSFSIAILGMGNLLLVIAIIVSNALLVLR